MMHDLDPRLYGIAPKEADAHEGAVLWTKEGVMRYLGISETTLRLTPDLMRLRRVIAPRVFRWIPDEVRAYVASLPTQDAPLTITQALKVKRSEVKSKQRVRRARQGWERELDAKIGWVPPDLPKPRRKKRAS